MVSLIFQALSARVYVNLLEDIMGSTPNSIATSSVSSDIFQPKKCLGWKHGNGGNPTTLRYMNIRGVLWLLNKTYQCLLYSQDNKVKYVHICTYIYICTYVKSCCIFWPYSYPIIFPFASLKHPLGRHHRRPGSPWRRPSPTSAGPRLTPAPGELSYVMGLPQARWMVYFMEDPNLKWMMTRVYPQFSSILDWAFPWNKPSSELGVALFMKRTHLNGMWMGVKWEFKAIPHWRYGWWWRTWSCSSESS